MAYKRRGRYWYRSVRDGQQVTTEYLGTGPLVDAMAEAGNAEAERRAQERRQFEAERRELRELDRKIDDAAASLRVLLATVLLAHGYHQHKGQWRRKRG